MRFKIIFLPLLLILFGSSISFCQIMITSNGSARATAYSEQNKIITLSKNGKSYTYIGYLDRTESFVLAENNKYSRVFMVKVAEIENATGKVAIVNIGKIWEKYLSEGSFPEPHGTPSLTLDHYGILHVIYGPHYDLLKYAFSNQNLFRERLTSFTDSTIRSFYSPSPGFDRWTYPVIKVDQEGTLHVVGSLDSDGNNDNNAKKVGYLRKKVNSTTWECINNPSDPLRHYTAKYQARYSIMLNIDKNNYLAVLVPDMSSSGDRNGFLNYYYYASTSKGNSFYKADYYNAYLNNDQLYENGLGNVAFDKFNYPHFLLYLTNNFYSGKTGESCPTEYQKWIKHVYLTPTGWNYEDNIVANIDPLSNYIHDAKIRIDNDNRLFIIFQASNKYTPSNCSNNATNSATKFFMAYKDLNFQKQEFKVEEIKFTGELIWNPSIEETEKFTFYKDWFNILYQSATLDSVPQEVITEKVIPIKNYLIQNNTFSSVSEIFAADKIELGNNVNSSELQGAVIFASNSTTTLIAKNKIVLTKGVKIEKGSYFKIITDNNLCEENICLNKSTFLNSNANYSSQRTSVAEENFPSDNQLTIYPNPSEGCFKINLSTTNTNALLIALYDIYGNRLISKLLSPGTPGVGCDLDVSNFPKGQYVVQANAGNRLFIQKLILH